MSHTLLNYAFLLFLNFLGEIHREHFFIDIKVTISETSTEILRIFFFLPCLKRANYEENLDLFKQLFLNKTSKVDKYYQKLFFPQSEPNTAKLCLSVALKNFEGNS